MAVTGEFPSDPTQPTAHPFMRGGKISAGPLTVSLVHVLNTNEDNSVFVPSEKTIPKNRHRLNGTSEKPCFRFATATIPKISDQWQKYEVTLTTGDKLFASGPSRENRLWISTTKSGSFWHRHSSVWFSQVSLFPPTFNNRANGNRPDLMQLLADMHPPFCVSGRKLSGGPTKLKPVSIGRKPSAMWRSGPATRMTAGATGQRTASVCWNFSGGCEDLKMQPVLAVYAGYSMRQRHVAPGDDLKPYARTRSTRLNTLLATQTPPGRATRQGRPSRGRLP